MPANIIFTEFTDPKVFFASRVAANQFFNAITVPDATTAVSGVIKKSGNIPATALPATTYVSLNALDAQGNVTITQVPSKNSYDQLYSFATNLLTALKAAGIMQGD